MAADRRRLRSALIGVRIAHPSGNSGDDRCVTPISVDAFGGSTHPTRSARVADRTDGRGKPDPSLVSYP
ncbi:hypothetical protein HALLA_18930 [Halostagnicola larsenii XH-48]|uniref:Uncharacterized protein n=1 Tax=Halostagnicola larsenii XH-48 TaxID=797299 RepID=W0JV82_9EURY|nr:hypothetical protein [Halostagnicola larsenii]AHG01180.1 hypothetical protein HALLA_18930 [Halostagnicola larsenii XH-48]